MLPITFEPLYMTRVWGGRSLETVFGRSLPDDQPYGESWELSDREQEQSIVASGIHAGMSLHDLWTGHREEIFGTDLPNTERFPLLLKILDACDDLSIQVHPPEDAAAELGGDPKTEMWYIAGAAPGSKLYIGLKSGTTRDRFASAIADGSVAELVHAVEPAPGESIFIPSGRLHAIGAGFVIYEIQQNSDTTYRVFDWNRTGLDGNPRDLHVEESLRCIDFKDYEPAMDKPDDGVLAHCPHFQVDRIALPAGDSVGNPDPGRFSILTVVSGSLRAFDGSLFHPGDFLLLPKGGEPLEAPGTATVLQTTIPR